MESVRRMPSMISLFFLLTSLRGADSICPRNCRPYLGTIHCNKTTGRCLTGCNTGFYGSNCECTCHCGGRACVRADGTCMQMSSAKPVQVCPALTQDCQTVGYIVGICLLCVVCVAIIAAGVFIHKVKTKRKQRSEGLFILSETEPMLQAEQKRLTHDLGVHFLDNPNRPNEPVFLYCVHMKFDYRRVNTSTTHIDGDRYLVNEPEMKSDVDQFPERFKTFSGTTSLSPTIDGDIPTYWEVNSHVELNSKLKPTDLLLCIGFCSEMERNKDEWFQTPRGTNSYNLNVGMCPKHEKICTKIYRGKKFDHVSDIQTDIENKDGENGNLNFGILVCKGKKVIVYFDVTKMKHIKSLENVDFERPLWPMFAVFQRSNPYVRMKLVTGRDIDMSQDKKDMILKALSSVKWDK